MEHYNFIVIGGGVVGTALSFGPLERGCRSGQYHRPPQDRPRAGGSRR